LWEILEEQEQTLPLSKVWDDTSLELPNETDAPSYRNIFTAEELNIVVDHGRRSLPLSQILQHFPVALLMGTSATEYSASSG
jgi:maltooligosyltrehalose synthase